MRQYKPHPLDPKVLLLVKSKPARRTGKRKEDKGPVNIFKLRLERKKKKQETLSLYQENKNIPAGEYIDGFLAIIDMPEDTRLEYEVESIFYEADKLRGRADPFIATQVQETGDHGWD